jgi:hypothetical protein
MLSPQGNMTGNPFVTNNLESAMFAIYLKLKAEL